MFKLWDREFLLSLLFVNDLKFLIVLNREFKTLIINKITGFK